MSCDYKGLCKGRDVVVGHRMSGCLCVMDCRAREMFG